MTLISEWGLATIIAELKLNYPIQVTNVLDFDYQVTIIVAIEQQEKTPPDNHSGMAIDRQRMVRNWVYKHLKIPV